jgi:hypothetical protein
MYVISVFAYVYNACDQCVCVFVCVCLCVYVFVCARVGACMYVISVCARACVRVCICVLLVLFKQAQLHD